MNLPNLKSSYCDFVNIIFGFSINKSIPRNFWKIFKKGVGKLERYFYYIYQYGEVKFGILTIVNIGKTRGKRVGSLEMILRVNPPVRKNIFSLKQINDFFDFFIKNQKKIKNSQITSYFSFPRKKFTPRVELPYPEKIPLARKNILQVSGIEFRRYLSKDKYDNIRIKIDGKGDYYFVRMSTSAGVSFDKYFIQNCLKYLYESTQLVVKKRR